MHPQQPYRHPQQPPQVVYVQQSGSKATAVGVWVLVLWFLGPALLVVLCCAGALIVGSANDIEGVSPRPSASSSP